jgi:hypothetical protein
MRYLYLLVCYGLFVSPVLAIYDLVSIDIIPSSEGTKFCFFLDTNEPEMYLAAENNSEFLFFDKELALSPLQPNTIPPVFLGKKMRPSCFGPFAATTLQDINLYAGAGASFDDIVANQKYMQFFNGFPTLTDDDKAWTVMVYLVGSSLERAVGPRGAVTKGFASKDILEMLAGTRQLNNANVVIATGGSARAGWKTVKRSLIQAGHQYVLEDLGNQNMANPQTLSDFVLWATTEFPAQHYALVLWDHGGGTQGIGQDTAQSQDTEMMSLNSLHHSYQTIRSVMDKPLDIVVYDACLMAAIEVVEITATVADAMAASVELEPGHGIDYAHLLRNVNESPPANGIDFGNVVKTGYIQHTKDKGTFASSQITYSVFDLTQLTSFSNTLQTFAFEFKQLLKSQDFLSYETLSHGIIRAPGYPLIATGQLRTLRSDTNNNHIRIDLYNILQTVGPELDGFSDSAQTLLNILDNMIVDYATNAKVQNIHPDAGRISLDINISNTSHLAVLPEAYTLLSEGLVYYDEKKQGDGFTPDGPKECYKGATCFFAQWLKLIASDILGVEAYFGQKSGETSIAYLVDNSFYQHQADLTEDLNLSVDGAEACQYQLCVDATACEDITLTKQGEQLLADVELNESPAVLSFCNSDRWSICGVAQQTGGIWGRDDVLYPGDEVVPYTLQIPVSLDNLPVPASQIESHQGKVLTVAVPDGVVLQKSCDEKKAAIWAVYYGLNKRGQTELLCDNGDCFCKKPSDDDSACKELGFKAGVSLEY